MKTRIQLTGACWPHPDHVRETIEALRGEPTDRQMRDAIAILGSYLHILTHPAGTVLKRRRDELQRAEYGREERHRVRSSIPGLMMLMALCAMGGSRR